MISYIACSWHIPYDYFTVNFSCFSLLMHISNIQLLCRKGQFEFFWEKKHSPSPGLADCIPRCHFTYSAAVVPVAGHRCLMRYRLLSDMRAVHGWSCPFPSRPIMRHRGSASVFSMWRWSPGSSCQHRLASFSLQFQPPLKSLALLHCGFGLLDLEDFPYFHPSTLDFFWCLAHLFSCIVNNGFIILQCPGLHSFHEIKQCLDTMRRGSLGWETPGPRVPLKHLCVTRDS